MEDNVFAIGDIHGEEDKRRKVIEVAEAHGFSLKKGHRLVQVGDKNDRGPQTFEVYEYFKNLAAEYPGQVDCLLGNHELMLRDAAAWPYPPAPSTTRTVKFTQSKLV